MTLWIRYSFKSGQFLEKEFSSWEEAKKDIAQQKELLDWKRVEWMEDEYYKMFNHIGE